MRRIEMQPMGGRGVAEIDAVHGEGIRYDAIYGAPNAPVGTMADAWGDAGPGAGLSGAYDFDLHIPIDPTAGPKFPFIDRGHDYTNSTSFGLPTTSSVDYAFGGGYVVARAIKKVILTDDGNPFRYEAYYWKSAFRPRFYTATQFFQLWWIEEKYGFSNKGSVGLTNYELIEFDEKTFVWTPEGAFGYGLPPDAMDFRYTAPADPTRSDFWESWSRAPSEAATVYEPDEPPDPAWDNDDAETLTEKLVALNGFLWSFVPGYKPLSAEHNGFPP